MTTTTLIDAIRGGLIGQAAHTQRTCDDINNKGPSGVIRDETKHTLTIETGNGTMKRITKSEHTILLHDTHEMGAVLIKGAAICQRSEDRISMKVTP